MFIVTIELIHISDFILDELFGKDNFRNRDHLGKLPLEIKFSNNQFPRVYDSILFLF